MTQSLNFFILTLFVFYWSASSWQNPRVFQPLSSQGSRGLKTSQTSNCHGNTMNSIHSRPLFRLNGKSSSDISMPSVESKPEIVSSKCDNELRLISFNILAPCYNKLKPNQLPTDSSESKEGTNKIANRFESELKDQYIARNNRICDELLSRDADLICVQEYWTQCVELKSLFESRLANRYYIKELQRTSHWRDRDDGLAVFVKKDRLSILDNKDILFHDCGDRVAQLVLLGIKMSSSSKESETCSMKYFICVNTHLLFPHNEYSTKIRVREMTKILDFVEAYRQTDLCQSVCGRSDVRIPVIIAGDFNGSPNGAVFQLMKSQNFRSSQYEYWSNLEKEEKEIDELISSSQEPCDNSHVAYSDTWRKWVSHKSHRNQIIPVDHVFFSNPIDQEESKLPAPPNWTNLVFRELKQRLIAEIGTDNMRDAFSIFDQDKCNYVTKEAFAAALKRLGFEGEGTPALTSEEIDLLVESADKNGDGLIDYKEFYDRFWIASENIESQNNVTGMKNAFKRARWLLDPTVSRKSEKTSSTTAAEYKITDEISDDAVLNETKVALSGEPLGNLKVKNVSLYPKELEMGIWPANYDLSDHGIVQVTFSTE